MNGVEDIVGGQVKGIAEGQGGSRRVGHYGQGRRPQQQTELPGVTDQEKPRVAVIVGGLKKPLPAEIFQAEGVGVLDQVVEIDEDPDQEKSNGRREGTPDQPDQARA